MKRVDHPGYTSYRIALDASQDAHQAVEAWRRSGDLISVHKHGLIWTLDSALDFVLSLAEIFQAYNQILWEVFPYCTMCRGGCCLIESPRISRFDLLALALLNEPFPLLPEGSQIRREVCFYLFNTRCAWPAAWRTMKCWMFYCLGGEGWQLSDPHDSNYRKMADALQAILGQGLPNELNTYEEITGQSLTSNLIDPLDAAENMERALEELFVQPFAARFPLGAAPSTGESPLNAPSLNGELFDFFTSMVDRIEAVEPEAAAQILADLETLEMIVMTGLEDPQNLLNEIRSRYIGADLDTIERQMGEFVGKLIDDT